MGEYTSHGMHEQLGRHSQWLAMCLPSDTLPIALQITVIVSIALFWKVTDFWAISSGTWGHCGLTRTKLALGCERTIRSMGQRITLGGVEPSSDFNQQ